MGECAERAAAVPIGPFGEKMGRVLTDNCGNFGFDGLEEDRSECRVNITRDGYEMKRVEVELADGVLAGGLYLDPVTQ